MNASPAKIRPSTEETRVKIMEAAERLFGEQGIEAVAMRAISIAAKQRNTASVQYHFGDRIGLLKAIFEYREGQFDAMRAEIMERGRKNDHLADIRWLLRALYYPYFRHYAERNGLPYIRLHFQYLANLRPRGVLHPMDYDCSSTVLLREVIDRLQKKLNFLNPQQFSMRLEATGAMFLSALMQHAARPLEPVVHAAVHFPSLFETLLEMMAASLTVPPWNFSRS